MSNWQLALVWLGAITGYLVLGTITVRLIVTVARARDWDFRYAEDELLILVFGFILWPWAVLALVGYSGWSLLTSRT